MSFIKTDLHNQIGILRLERGKVNAINGEVVQQLSEALKTFENNSRVKSVLLTGTGHFFSFGFDVPEFLSYSKSEFSDYLKAFTDLYTAMFLYPKPLIAGLNGHTIAGGCMLALACDARIMATGKARISLNEIQFGASVLAGSVEMLRFCAGNKNATSILYSGNQYSAEEAKSLGMVDEVTSEEQLIPKAIKLATFYGEKSSKAFSSTKSLIRHSIAEEMKQNEKDSIKNFIGIWYSESTWGKLKDIKIH